MAEPGDPRWELEKVRAALAAQEALQGTLPGEQLEAMAAPLLERLAELEAALGEAGEPVPAAGAQEAEPGVQVPPPPPLASSAQAAVEGSGSLAQGPGAVAAGAGSIVAGHDLHVHPPPPPPGASRETLEAAYLHRVAGETSRLALEAVDRAAADQDAASRLRLDAVYTALLTLGQKERDGEGGPEEARGARVGEPLSGEARRPSAVEQLDGHRHLVLLGDPGSGKSTFVNFVTLCLAGERLGWEHANLAALTAPLPRDRQPWEEEKEEPQPWRRGPLLPVRVVLRDFAATGLPAAGEAATGKHLWEFIAGRLKADGLGAYVPHLEAHLFEEGGLALLDGLDEVPEAESRRRQIKEAVEAFAGSHPKCRLLLTSRTYAYQKQEWRLPGFDEAVLAPFGEAQIERFVQRWYEHVAGLGRFSAEDAAGRAQLLLRAIAGSDRLRSLAERPLLLTLMASLHAWRGGSLPERREQLYDETVDLLLDRWESRRLRRGPKGELLVEEPSLAEWLRVDREKVRGALEELAFEAHGAQPELQDTADIPQGELVSRLMALHQDPNANPARLVAYLSQRAGLLIPRGVAVYTFPHRTLQEYLAACHLTGAEFPDQVAELARSDPERWREVVLLAGAKAAGGAASTVWELAEALCCHEAPPAEDPEAADPADEWGAHLAAQALVESADLEHLPERQRHRAERLQGWLLHLMRRSRLPALERALAGDHLARFGDPRFDPERWYLPREPLLGFVEVPAGSFWMGSDPEKDPEADAEEQPQHEVELPTFYLARYPVTLAQLRAFVEATGHEVEAPRALWGWPGNRPAVMVSWYDALAYCRWLGERLGELARERAGEEGGGESAAFWQGLAAGQLRATLPSEAEWEKAARGSEGRRYPWGPEPDPERMSVEETGLGDPSPVGCFPAGASAYGCEELSGNVWEWTRSLWGEPEFTYPYQPSKGREDESAVSDILRVLRGGSYLYLARGARCAFRVRLDPRGRHFNVGFRVVLSPFNSEL